MVWTKNWAYANIVEVFSNAGKFVDINCLWSCFGWIGNGCKGKVFGSCNKNLNDLVLVKLM